MPIKSVRYYLVTGLFSILPLAATYWIILKLFQFFAKPGATIVQYIFQGTVPKYVPELSGFILTILFIYFTGIFVTNVLGNRFYAWIEKGLSRIPIVNSVYKTIKQITSGLSNPDRQAFKKVVLIEYPRRAIWTLTMVTGESVSQNGEKYYHIFVPTTPNPTSGYMLYIPQKDTREAGMTVEEGLKIIVSGGMLAPGKNPLQS